jgi:O-antigen/teichoic acid export membrane protein
VALLADPIVRLVLGGQWLAAAPLVRIMALASLTMFPAFLTYPMLVSLGHMKDVFIASLISLPPNALMILVAAKFGLHAVAASMFLTAPLQVYIALRFVRRRVPFTWGEMFAATLKSAVVTLTTALAPAAAVAYSGFRFDLSPPVTFVTGIGAIVGWFAGLRITGHPLMADELQDAMRQIASAARSVLGRV